MVPFTTTGRVSLAFSRRTDDSIAATIRCVAGGVSVVLRDSEGTQSVGDFVADGMTQERIMVILEALYARLRSVLNP